MPAGGLLNSSPSAPVRLPGVLILMALAPLWFIGMFGRGLWTPDEPREADIAWRMSLQSDRTLPQLAGTPFLEKPPLSYWMSGAAVALLGDSPAAARTPNLLYALITALAVGALALAMHAQLVPAVLAALMTSSALMAYRVTIWLAPDAALLAGCALALLGVWRGYCAPAGARKAAGYALMHAGAAIGFMAKSAPGWLVPGLALLTLIVWERRWRELARWELYAGFALQALIIGPWLLAVARAPHGANALLTLFWHNVIGRFTPVAAPAALEYTSGHHNSPGKYLLELPLYLLPWTVVVIAALVRGWHRMRAAGAAGTPWRFALAASVPFLALLSVAATARDVYAAPALLGLGVLAGLWAHEAQNSAWRFDRLALRLTAALVGVLGGAFAATLLVLAASGLRSWPVSIAGAGGVLVLTATALLGASGAARTDVQRSLAWSYTGYAAALSLTALIVLPVIDRWQDLPQLARRIHADTAHESLALLDPDETTVAMLDHGLRTRFTMLTSAGSSASQVVGDWFSTHGREARVLVLLPGHAPGPLSHWLAHFHPPEAPGDGVAARLISSASAALVQRYELPQGRRYALLGPP
jgi:4-amino-4-deoxy-L-arabinose transferase-like glycosyltransferase